MYVYIAYAYYCVALWFYYVCAYVLFFMINFASSSKCRRYFYAQLKRSYLSGCWERWTNAVKLAAYILHIEFGDYSGDTHEEYSQFLVDCTARENSLSLQSVFEEYGQLSGVDQDSAIEQFLSIAYESEDYGLEKHLVTNKKGVPVTVSVGPSAIFVVNETTQVKTK